MKIAVLGGGSWATALVKMLTENLDEVHWYMRSTYAMEHIKREGQNPSYLSSVQLNNDYLQLTTDINEAIKTCDVLLFVIPSAFLEKELALLKVSLKGKTIFSAIKGIVPESGRIVGEHFHYKYDIPCDYPNIFIGDGVLLENTFIISTTSPMNILG